MIDSIYTYYQKQLTPYKLVYKHMKKYYFAYLLLMIIFIISYFSTFIFESIPCGIATALLYVFILLYLKYPYDKKVKKVIEKEYEEYKIVDSKLLTISYIKKLELINYVKALCPNEILYDKEKITKIAELTFKSAEESKFSGFLLPAIYVALAAPIYTKYTESLYKDILIHHPNNVVNYTFAILLVIIPLICILIEILIRASKSVLLEFLDRENKKRKKLAVLLEEIALEMH